MKDRRGRPRQSLPINVLWTLVLVVVLLTAVLVPTGLAQAAECSNEAFRSGSSSGLPDCRAYEQVTPIDKNGGFASGFENHVVAAEEGPGLTYFSSNGTTIPATGSGSTADFPTFLAKRGSAAWSSQVLLPPQSLGEKAQFLGITPDLGYDVVQALNKDYKHPGFGRGLYVIDTQTESLSMLVPPESNEEEYPYAFDGASKTGSRIFFETRAAAAEGAIEGIDNLYVWERQTGKVSLAGRLPESEGGEVPTEGAFGGAYDWYASQSTSNGGALAGLAVGALHAISESGSQIYFTAANTPSGESGQLYLRKNLDTPDPTTVRISLPNPGVPVPPVAKPASFQEATPDGAVAFFLSASKLTNNATTGPAEEGSDLYLWNANTGLLTDITPDTNTETPNGAEVEGLLGTSRDGSSGFFVAGGVLADGAKPGAANLYQFTITGGQVSLIFVAVLGPGGSPPVWAAPTAEKASRVSGNGRTVIFNSAEPITGYPNESRECTLGEPAVAGPCEEMFRFEAGSTGPECISCSPFGAPPAGQTSFRSAEMFSKAAQFPENPSAVVFTQNLSENGDRAFFQTPQALVPGDTNGATECVSPRNGAKGGLHECQDVYEWEAVGAPGGSCTRVEVNGGCLYLLSNGESDRPSYFAGASTDGANAYLLTTSQLTPSDTDLAADFYDAVVGGGLPAQQRSPVSSCAGEGCLGPPSPAPPSAGLGSTELRSPGNTRAGHTAKKKQKKHRKSKHRTKKGGKHRRAEEKPKHGLGKKGSK